MPVCSPSSLGERVFDILIASILLILVSLPLLVLALLIRMNLDAPIIFRQERLGWQGRIFTIYKFRTMHNKKDHKGELLSDEDRLTKFGAFLRKWSLDELPQLFNVLKGDMRMVGPRPLLAEYLTLFTKEQFRRHNVKPGITGLAQINGRNHIQWTKKFEYDLWYVDHHSFWMDIKIIIFTLKQLLKPTGISQYGYVTVEKFKGNGHS